MSHNDQQAVLGPFQFLGEYSNTLQKLSAPGRFVFKIGDNIIPVEAAFTKQVCGFTKTLTFPARK